MMINKCDKILDKMRMISQIASLFAGFDSQTRSRSGYVQISSGDCLSAENCNLSKLSEM